MEDFQYVVKKQERTKICFGSGCPRDMSKKGMTSFMRYYTKDNYENIAPGTYNVMNSFLAIKNKPCSHSISNKGYGGIIRAVGAIEHKNDFPSPADYNLIDSFKPVKESKAPFSSFTKTSTFSTNINPGPGTYTPVRKKEIAFEHSFGGRVKMKLGVQLKCCSNNTDVCKNCGQKPKGDYWHWKDKIFLCRLCMINSLEKQSKYKREELNHFSRVRDCSDIHRHDGTDANIWLMHPKLLRERLVKETYLSSYLKN
ncbi:PREDICTED: uncharacterized protein LOC107070510 [Polistes dominula]|uniref:Uncharacterized protein LOC107070510 n=1 Tax=Polistes dominula TaxID=743375 RepID=A0ABM1IVM7_POLDO|nr:PREDICTED: uncharacterized protein LOC107070510 [Polistes dominula]